MFCDKPQTMSLLSVCTELEENKTSDKARNSAKTALAPRAETGIRDPRAHRLTPVQGHDSLEILSPLSKQGQDCSPRHIYSHKTCTKKPHFGLTVS